MAQVTALQITGLPGPPRSFIAKAAITPEYFYPIQANAKVYHLTAGNKTYHTEALNKAFHLISRNKPFI